MYNVVILGGTSGFGEWLASYIWEHFSQECLICITGRDAELWNTVAQRLGLTFSSDNREAVKKADIVIYSVPIAVTQQVIEETLPYVKSGAVVADVTSIKKFPSSSMQKREDIIVIPTHPMFGPYISSIAGQVFVLTPNENVQTTKEYQFLKNFLKTQKARVIESTPSYHDRMMAVVQGLTHLNMFVVGETMKRLKFNIADSMDFISPIYKLMVSSVGRYLGQNPWLYADIQMYNDEVLEVHEKFLDTAKNFHTSVKSKDTDKFCQDIIEAREALWIDNCQEGQEYTDKVIYMLWKQVDVLKNNMWKHILLKNIYSGEEVSWILQNFEKWKISLDSWESYSIDVYEVIEYK